ncbi:putative poly(A)-specific ribonuclease [Rosa chinensis]|uniref:Putative poly(A)-specific ribonuclease n=1 Tax=Rosa chinensis TaxID=74649 RepID=A0A2P6PHN6_ROSCH|nr:carbon catabolite repressor protein 4 homolog 1-like [Rosa chinensis]PRQ21418.1 putative poly(A)-specific ribonuclease [Rosa chinensis]
MDPPPNPNVGSSSSRRPDAGSSSSPRPEVGSSSSSTRPEVGSSSSSSLSLARFSLSVRMGTTQSITPVFGCRIDPTARVPKKDGEAPPEHEFSFKWYREYISPSIPRDKIKCSVHPDEVATFQCNDCVKLKLPFKGSYHCSPTCYSEAWGKHRMCHRCAKAVGETSSDNQQAEEEMYSWLDFEDDPLNEIPKLERDGKQWVEVCSSRCYVPTVNDLNCRLMLESKAVDCSTGLDLCLSDIIMTVPVLYPPHQKPRSMLECRRKLGDSDLKAHTCSGVKFSVLSYNVLGNLYTDPYRYSYCPEWARSWEYRQQNLLNEIIEYDADILCLQEVQSNHLEYFFEPELAKCGYSVIYKKRRGSFFVRDGSCMDGCATFYRRDVFKEIVKYEHAFDSSVMRVIEALQPLEPQQRNRACIRLQKDNVALVVILEKLESEGTCDGIQPRICVANTHISANPQFPDVKLFQVVDLITGLDKIAKMKIPLLVCGDFNSLPLSEPHKFITAGRVDNLPNDTDPFGICQHLKLHHSLPLKSAYASFYNSDGIEEEQRRKFNSESREPLFTHFTPSFTGTLDYLFYTEDSLTLDGVLELLDRDNLGVGIPSLFWSSDHIALIARFILNSTSPQQQGSQVIPADLWP